jgi:hypothetical protein
MFDPIQPRPRGLSGRPLIALVGAVGAGIAEYYVGLRLHLTDTAVSVIVVSVFAVVAYVWYLLEQPK